MKIKLVIWDLDNTLWDGILDEGEVLPRTDRVGMIFELNDRGVLNSVCSKNDFQLAIAKLRELSLADEMIFPAIAWEPKGSKVKSIIEDFQLRAENVLFIDDEETNLKEVSFYNPHINTLNAARENVNDVLKRILAENNNDGRKRFNQYKNLERKNIARKAFGDNKQFLRESEISITLDSHCGKYLDRIEELINRTNQLNFTKKRLSTAELKEVIGGDNENFVVFARDKFGDYGLVGFVSFRRNANELEHFVFSCRVLNMGIEQYVYDKLGCPAINVSGEVSAKLAGDGSVDWVREEGARNSTGLRNEEKPSLILIAGGCDLFQLHHYLKSQAELDTYFNYPSVKYGVELHRDSLIYLYASRFYSTRQREMIIGNFPFVAPDFFAFPGLEKYDLVIYSPLVDYLQNTYAYREDPEVVISWGDFTNPTGNIYDEKEFLKSVGLTEAAIAELSSKWIPLGPISPADFLSKLQAVFGDYKGKLILLGGASKYFPGDQEKYLEHHRRLNAALKSFQKIRPATFLIDIDAFLNGPGDYSGSVRHYQKVVYSRLAQYVVKNFSGLGKKPAFMAALTKQVNRLSRIASRIQMWLSR
jgi:FkbH-like protein